MEDRFPRCTFEHCQDYLTIQNRIHCNHCKFLFCLEHRFPFSHFCSMVPPKEEIKENEIISFPKCTEPSAFSAKPFGLCKMKDCNQKLDLVNQFTCPHCEHIFCMSHRFDFSHHCSNIKKST
jgi:hypothetical protein